jgi:CubicO group peptidase (beta-lactamase class C family)
MSAMKAIIAAVVFGFVAVSAAAQDAAARMDQVVQSYVPARFMGTVLVARGDTVVLSKAYGAANLEWNIPNTPATKFRLGSLTKQFTAASILLLEERGKLKVDEPVKTYLPDAPAAWDKITIFNLLTHSSGIPNFTSFPDYAATQAFATPVEKVVARFRDKPLDFAPGEKMSYSNSGYVLLGYLIERITGGSYATFVQDNIFTPLGMKDSGYDSNSAVILRRASGYAPSPTGPVNAGFIHMSIPHAAGALYSTTEDLLKWQQALHGARVVSAASLQKMTTPFKGDYAFGLVVRTVNGRKMIAHGGGIEGFNTSLSYFPDEKLTIVVLSNINGPTADELGSKLEVLAHGGTVTLPTERKETTVAASLLASYVGTYELRPGVAVSITLDGNQLSGQLTGQQKFPIYAESDTLFFFKVVDASIEFDKGARPAAYLTLRQNGREMKATRKN